MDRPKLYLVPFSAPPLLVVPWPDKTVPHYGRLWPRSLVWYERESSPLPARPGPAKLRSVPPPVREK